MSTVSSSKKITLKSSDGEVFEVDEAVTLESPTIKHMIEEDSADNEIHLPNVRSKILAKVIEYCKKHVEAQSTNREERTSDDDLRAWDAEFIKVDQDTLFGLFLVGPSLLISKSLILSASFKGTRSFIFGTILPFIVCLYRSLKLHGV